MLFAMARSKVSGGKHWWWWWWWWWFGWLVTQRPSNTLQGRTYSHSCPNCHAEIKAAKQTCSFTQSQYTDTGPTSPSVDPVAPDAQEGSNLTTNVEFTGMTRPGKSPTCRAGIEPRSAALQVDTLTTGPTRRWTP